MKKLILTLCLIFFISVAYSQKGFHIGWDGHFYSSWIINQNAYGKPEMEYDETWGYSTGLDLGYNFLEFFGVQVEFRYANLGQEYDDLVRNPQNQAIPTVRKIDLRYYQIPVLLKYTGGQGNPKFYFLIGPQFNFLTKASFEQKGAYEEIEVDAMRRFKESDFGIAFGTGAQIGLTPSIFLNAGLRFYYGTQDINSPDLDPRANCHCISGVIPPGQTWQYTDTDGEYAPSKNAYGGISVGFHYLIGSKKYQLEEVDDPIIR